MVNKKLNIFSNSKNIEQSIFKDETVFYPDYFPENIVSRDSQITDFKFNLEPLISKKKANNLLVYGPSGTGKTLVSNFILNQLSDFSTKIKFTYINVIQDNSRFAILSKLVSFYDGIMPRRGLAVDEIWDRLVELFKKSDFFPVIILDEIDKLSSDECSKLLYDLARFFDKSKYFTLVLITNNKYFINDLDARTQSSLSLTEIEFAKYKPIELKNILKERIDFGLINDSITDDLIGYVTGFAASRNGDARIAIDLIYKAAKLSEKKGNLKITKEVLLECSNLLGSLNTEDKLKDLSEKEKEFFFNLKDGTDSSKVTDYIDVSSRTARRYLDKLSTLNLITLTPKMKGKGNTRVIKINLDRTNL